MRVFRGFVDVDCFVSVFLRSRCIYYFELAFFGSCGVLVTGMKVWFFFEEVIVRFIFGGRFVVVCFTVLSCGYIFRGLIRVEWLFVGWRSR